MKLAHFIQNSPHELRRVASNSKQRNPADRPNSLVIPVNTTQTLVSLAPEYRYHQTTRPNRDDERYEEHPLHQEKREVPTSRTIRVGDGQDEETEPHQHVVLVVPVPVARVTKQWNCQVEWERRAEEREHRAHEEHEEEVALALQELGAEGEEDDDASHAADTGGEEGAQPGEERELVTDLNWLIG